jgi:lactate dehydrogenase-like 2-hydroxyacid dehydrogenase
MTNAERKAYGKRVLNRFKLSKGCKVCGYKKHPAALELNHREPKLKMFHLSTEANRIALKRTTKSKIEYKEELAKCDVLCANCHRIHTNTYLRELNLNAKR